ncbi:hypothetical protein WN943_011039 [Citrus x changshan-huyou]
MIKLQELASSVILMTTLKPLGPLLLSYQLDPAMKLPNFQRVQQLSHHKPPQVRQLYEDP